MSSWRVSVCCAVLGCAAVAAPREKVIFDTDIGGDVDDALALSYLVCEPRCELIGVTIEGDDPDKKAEVASAICTALGRADIPVHPGCRRPIWGNHKFRNSPDALLAGRDEPSARRLYADELGRGFPPADDSREDSRVGAC